MMKKLMNDPDAFVDEYLDGVVAAYPQDLRRADDDQRVVTRAWPSSPGKVGIVTGGGSGHLPLFLGYVGEGLVSAVAVGNVFSAQSADAAEAAIRAADGGAGVLALFGNYTGDRLNFELASDLAQADGIATRIVTGTDDVASAPPARATDRRGVAGIAFAFKCAGAAAERGDDLDTVCAIARSAIERTKTMGVGLSPTTLPTTGRPTFTLGEDQMELGIGIHGEPGVRREKLASADLVADELLAATTAELQLRRGDEVALLVNGMGATSPEELFIVTRRIHQRLGERGVDVHRFYVGEYATSMEMAGLSISLMDLDDELGALLDAPCYSPLLPGNFR